MLHRSCVAATPPSFPLANHSCLIFVQIKRRTLLMPFKPSNPASTGSYRYSHEYEEHGVAKCASRGSGSRKTKGWHWKTAAHHPDRNRHHEVRTVEDTYGRQRKHRSVQPWQQFASGWGRQKQGWLRDTCIAQHSFPAFYSSSISGQSRQLAWY